MTLTIVTVTALFIMFTLPGSIVSGYFYQELDQTKIGSLIVILCDNITFSFHAFQLLFLLLTNKIFCKEFMDIKSVMFLKNSI